MKAVRPSFLPVEGGDGSGGERELVSPPGGAGSDDKGSPGHSCGEMLQKMILENQRLRQEIKMLRGHGVDKREVGLLQLCGGMRSSVSGKVAQSERGTDVTLVLEVECSAAVDSRWVRRFHGGGSGLTGGGQPEAGNLFGASGHRNAWLH